MVTDIISYARLRGRESRAPLLIDRHLRILILGGITPDRIGRLLGGLVRLEQQIIAICVRIRVRPF